MRLALEVRYLERCLERGGKSHRWCVKEHPHMHGIVCVEVLAVTRTIRVGVPKTPAEADATVCALPNTVRVHDIIRTRSQCPILREVFKNEEIDRSCGPIPREVFKRLKIDRSRGPIPREVLKRLKIDRSRGPIPREV